MITLFIVVAGLVVICSLHNWRMGIHQKEIRLLEKKLEMQRWEIDVQNIKLTAIQERLIAGG